MTCSKSSKIIIILIASLALTLSPCILRSEELFKIRIENRTGGLVSVNADGRTYCAVGKVLRPATAGLTGFAAAEYITAGKVAATAVHGIRIKTGDQKDPSSGRSKPLMISLVPFEFATIPKGFGGHIPLNSGIYTDIPAGKTIFRNLAPYVGNLVYLEKGDKLEPLPANYVPGDGDVIVIAVSRPDRWIKEISFENRRGGKVTVVYADGENKVITRVDTPVEGVGRFDGTSYTGRGRINTNHPGVITVSTAPVSTAANEGVGPERRGGFQIIPTYHALSQPGPMPQVMTVGPTKPHNPVIEGKDPLFSAYLGLSWDQFDDGYSFVTQVRIDDGEWEDLPEVVGKIDNAFTASGLRRYFQERGVAREVHKGVTEIRILFPSDDRKFITAEASRASQAFASAVSPASEGKGITVVSGIYALRTPLWYLPTGALVTFFVDGKVTKISTSTPHQYDWNTALYPDGDHVVDIRASDAGGNIIKTSTLKLKVRNN